MRACFKRSLFGASLPHIVHKHKGFGDLHDKHMSFALMKVQLLVSRYAVALFAKLCQQ